MSQPTSAPVAGVLLALFAGAPLPGSVASAGPPAAGPKPSERIGVFLRCTGEEEPRKALAAVKSLGLDRIQVSRLPDRYYTPEGAKEFAGLLKAVGVRSESVVVVFEGESYKDQESVVRTVGFRPVELREARLDYARRCVDFAAAIGTKIVTLHMGVLPRDPQEPIYRGMLAAVGALATYAAGKDVTISLETGQETGEELSRFLDKLTEVRVGVNFDTANLVLYGLDDPARALERLRGRVTSVHVKDGMPPENPARLGREVRLGEGRAQVAECLRILEKSGFQGPLIIENYVWRERGTDPLEELARARDFIRASLGR
jgi:sugar phosphate isomerase/epimerase